MSFRKRLKAGILCILVSGLRSLGPLIVTTASAEDTQPSGVSEDASAVLARMSKTLQAKEFSFRSRMVPPRPPRTIIRTIRNPITNLRVDRHTRRTRRSALTPIEWLACETASQVEITLAAR